MPRLAASARCFPASNGWATAARRLDLQHGTTRVDLAGGSLMMAQVGDFSLTSTAPTLRAPVAAPAQDRRFAYPVLARAQVGDDLAVGGFTVAFADPGVTGVSGIERVPISTEEKAELEATIGWDSKDLKQFAVTLDNVPQAILDAEDQLRGVLETEMKYRVNLALDQHVVTGIEAAAPPSGKTGSTLIEQTRNAVAASRALGANPTVLLRQPDRCGLVGLGDDRD